MFKILNQILATFEMCRLLKGLHYMHGIITKALLSISSQKLVSQGSNEI
jgi:hypothetical protein